MKILKGQLEEKMSSAMLPTKQGPAGRPHDQTKRTSSTCGTKGDRLILNVRLFQVTRPTKSKLLCWAADDLTRGTTRTPGAADRMDVLKGIDEAEMHRNLK